MPKILKFALFFSVVSALILGLSFLVSYHEKQSKIHNLHIKQSKMLNLAKTHLKRGDLIFRTGQDADSAIISSFDDNGWSHVGFALSGDFIIHSAPKDEFSDGLSIISLENFIKGAKKIGIARYDFDEQNILKIEQNLKEKLGQKFELSTNAKSAQSYCTSVINEAFKSSGINTQIAPSDIKLPFIQGSFILPSAFWNDENISRILVIF